MYNICPYQHIDTSNEFNFRGVLLKCIYTERSESKSRLHVRGKSKYLRKLA